MNYVVPSADVLPKAIDIATNLAGMGPATVQRIKDASIALQRDTGQLPSEAAVDDQRRAARERIAAYREDPNLLEGMRAFADSKTPQYALRRD